MCHERKSWTAFRKHAQQLSHLSEVGVEDFAQGSAPEEQAICRGNKAGSATAFAGLGGGPRSWGCGGKDDAKPSTSGACKSSAFSCSEREALRNNTESLGVNRGYHELGERLKKIQRLNDGCPRLKGGAEWLQQAKSVAVGANDARARGSIAAFGGATRAQVA
jgi:hypothetical protein